MLANRSCHLRRGCSKTWISFRRWRKRSSRTSSAPCGRRMTRKSRTSMTSRAYRQNATSTFASMSASRLAWIRTIHHVDRGKFDLMLLQHANKLGAAVYEGVKVKEVDFGPKEPIVRFNMGSREMGVSAKMVVDASGRNTFLGNQMKLKIKDPVFDQYAIHTWFDGYDRRAFAKKEAQLNFIFVHFLPISNTWIWQIPITDSVTSVGVVTQKKHFAKSRKDREQFFWEAVGTRPLLQEKLKQADQMHAFKDEGDYSYAMKQLCGDRFLMVGDAGRFVDPIFSTGVSIALNSSRFAHKDILNALEKNEFSRENFATFENTLRLGTKNWYDFITVYYRLNVLFTYF